MLLRCRCVLCPALLPHAHAHAHALALAHALAEARTRAIPMTPRRSYTATYIRGPCIVRPVLYCTVLYCTILYHTVPSMTNTSRLFLVSGRM
ncbi:hypothetical protein BC567DRAFT_75942 [Phyllosticta citribraziliensis]